MKAFRLVLMGFLMSLPMIGHADFHIWEKGKCAVYDEKARFKEYTNDLVCGKDYYQWDGQGFCMSYSGGGRPKGTVRDGLCGPSKFEWVAPNKCAQVSGGGHFQRYVKRYHCQGLAQPKG